uniref:Uncharacterized protein n=1 Tax=Aegilops tauschii subsp. strangulata TaxID=200361 RepID=A0A453SUG1_AEGTS
MRVERSCSNSHGSLALRGIFKELLCQALIA